MFSLKNDSMTYFDGRLEVQPVIEFVARFLEVSKRPQQEGPPAAQTRLILVLSGGRDEVEILGSVCK